MSETLAARDPKVDPQKGDKLRKQLPSSNWTERHVIDRIGNDIMYASRPDGPQRRCWISTWLEWASEAELCPA